MRRRRQVSANPENPQGDGGATTGPSVAKWSLRFQEPAKLPRPGHVRQHKCFLKLLSGVVVWLFARIGVALMCLVGDGSRETREGPTPPPPPSPPQRTRDSSFVATCCTADWTEHMRRRRAEDSRETAATSFW